MEMGKKCTRHFVKKLPMVSREFTSVAEFNENSRFKRALSSILHDPDALRLYLHHNPKAANAWMPDGPPIFTVIEALNEDSLVVLIEAGASCRDCDTTGLVPIKAAYNQWIRSLDKPETYPKTTRMLMLLLHRIIEDDPGDVSARAVAVAAMNYDSALRPALIPLLHFRKV